MRGRTVIGIFIVMVMFTIGSVYAFGSQDPPGTNACQNQDVEKVKQFEQETQSQRGLIKTKKLELRKEYRKEVPDDKRISTLKQEIRDLKASIQQAANKYDVDVRCLKGHHRAKRMRNADTQ